MIRPINYAENLDVEVKKVIWGYNELIAHYMGYKYFPFRQNEDQTTLNQKEYSQSAGWKVHKKVSGISKMNTKETDYLCRTVRGMAYHYDWNWLMPVVAEILVRHGFYIYIIGGTACSIYKDDLSKPLSHANGQPQHFHVEHQAEKIGDMVKAMWQCVADTVYFILNNIDPKIPVIEEYTGAIPFLRNLDITGLSDLPGTVE